MHVCLTINAWHTHIQAVQADDPHPLSPCVIPPANISNSLALVVRLTINISVHFAIRSIRLAVAIALLHAPMTFRFPESSK